MKRLFFELLRAGLWGKEPTFSKDISDKKWERILEVSVQQSVTGVIFDGISLQSAQKPSWEGLMDWTDYIVQIEQTNRQLNEFIEQIGKKFVDEGLHPIMVKGQGIAALYRNPLHRMSGDIDLYLTKNEYKKALELILAMNPDSSINDGEHACLHFGDKVLELHRSLMHSHLLPVANRMHRWFNDEIKKDTQNYLNVAIPGRLFNVVFGVLPPFSSFYDFGVWF